MKLATLLLVLATAVGTCHAATTQPIPTGSISGTVRLAGKPEAGVVVWLDAPVALGGHANYTSVTTGKDGTYSFHYLPAGTFGVHQVVPAGQTETYPPGGLLVPTLTAGMQVQQADFTNVPVATPVAVLPPATLPVIVQQPPVVPPVIVLPPPLPTTAPASGITCGVGPTAGVTPTYTTGPTGVAWLSASSVSTTRHHRRLWHTAAGYPAWPDPRHAADPVAYPALTIQPDDCLSTQAIAVVYDTAGTYAASVDVWPVDDSGVPAGPVVTYAQRITRPIDGRPQYVFAATGNDAGAGTAAAPLLSPAKLAALAGKGNVRLTIVAPYTLDWPAGVNVGPATTIEGQPAADGTLPVLHLGANEGFTVNASSGDVLVRRLEFTSTGVQTGNALAAPTGDHGARAEAGQSWGNGVLFDQCRFNCLKQITEQWGGDGFGVTRSVQVDPLAIAGQGIASWGGRRTYIAFDVLTGCYGEATSRWSNPGVGDTLAVEWNLLQQTDVSHSDKAVVDIRSCVGRGVVAHNAIVNSQVSLSTGHMAANTVAADVLVTGNVYRTTDGQHPDTYWVVVKEAVQGLTVTGEDFGPKVKSTAITVNPNPATSDVVIGPARGLPAGMPLTDLSAGQTAARMVTALPAK